ncbi:MAG: hypothetical protein ACREC0_13925 [Methylocella sp.]
MAFLKSKRRKLPLSDIGRVKIQKLSEALVFVGSCILAGAPGAQSCDPARKNCNLSGPKMPLAAISKPQVASSKTCTVPGNWFNLHIGNTFGDFFIDNTLSNGYGELLGCSLPFLLTVTLQGTTGFTVNATYGGTDCQSFTETLAWQGSCNTASGTYVLADGKSGGDTWARILPRPVNFRQVSPGVAMPDGVLHFEYSWDSSTGDLADLKDCKVGENVMYPGSADPFPWPCPPFAAATTPNPTILWVSGTVGNAEDNHKHKRFLVPYVANACNATQTYRYMCASLGIVDFPD